MPRRVGIIAPQKDPSIRLEIFMSCPTSWLRYRRVVCPSENERGGASRASIESGGWWGAEKAMAGEGGRSFIWGRGGFDLGKLGNAKLFRSAPGIFGSRLASAYRRPGAVPIRPGRSLCRIFGPSERQSKPSRAIGRPPIRSPSDFNGIFSAHQRPATTQLGI